MKILQIPASQRDTPITVILFGLGLIGSAVERAFIERHAATGRYYPYDWQDVGVRAAQVKMIEAAIVEENTPAPRYIALVWAGGRSGFAATEEQMLQETALIGEVIDFMQGLRCRLPDTQLAFHLLSSAGGLFEGQTVCTNKVEPFPLRAYGDGKLAQELLLQKSPAFDRCCIYRPSSVYGFERFGRAGLITALAVNAIRGCSTRIFGGLNTLRDFVWADDIGRHIARRIAVPGTEAVRVELLADGRAASMFEVIRLVEQAVDKPLRLQFDPNPSNARNMSFLPSALPVDWQRIDLATGVAQIVMQARRHLYFGN